MPVIFYPDSVIRARDQLDHSYPYTDLLLGHVELKALPREILFWMPSTGR